MRRWAATADHEQYADHNSDQVDGPGRALSPRQSQEDHCDCEIDEPCGDKQEGRRDRDTGYSAS